MNAAMPALQVASPAAPGAIAALGAIPAFDPILFWNDVALEANRVSHTNGLGEQAGPPLSARALAIVHLAMYDAYARIINDAANLPVYLANVALAAPPTTAATVEAVTTAAVAGAAHETLAVLFPSQIAAFDAALAMAGSLGSAGHVFGRQVAQAILQDRDNDPGAGAGGYAPPAGRGLHSHDPDNHPDDPGKSFHAPAYGSQARAFAITDPMRHALDAPPWDNAEYRAALAEVRRRGIAPYLMGTLSNSTAGRTPSETVRGIFWGYDGAPGLGTPPRLYNQIVRAVAIARNNTVAQNARLFALVNVAMADAGILAWEQKYIYNFWRPVLGVREHDLSMGVGAAGKDGALAANCDPGWLPLGAPATNRVGGRNFTPPFPAYPSGHATFGAAALHMVRLFYGVQPGNRSADTLFRDPATGKDMAFVSEEFNGANRDTQGTVRPHHARTFKDGLWGMIIENGQSRVDLGVHWVFDAFALKAGTKTPDLERKVGGVPMGLAIAEDIFASGMVRSNVGPLATAGAGAGAASFADAISAALAAPRTNWRDRVPYPPIP